MFRLLQGDYIESVLPDILDYHVLGDLQNELGRALIELGRAENVLMKEANIQDVVQQDSLLLQILTSPDDVDLANVSGDSFGVWYLLF